MIRREILRLYGALPKAVRRFIVRRVAPTWTAGAVAILERDDGRWLMVSPVYRRGWSLPGGLIDRGEDPATAVVREFAEEVGLQIEVDGDPWIVYDSAARRVDAIFRASLTEPVDLDAVTIGTPELDGVGWFDPANPPELEEETEDVLALLRDVEHGGGTIRWR